MPQALRETMAAGITAVRTENWDRLGRVLPRNLLPPLLGDKLHKAAMVLKAQDADDIYRRVVSHWDPAEIVPRASEPRGPLWDASIGTDFPHLLDRMQFLDLVTYLPDDILTKVDRASMAVALEARVPLLDHRVIELAWRLPHSARIRGGTTKWLARQVLYRHVPRQLIERPKMGFGIPLGDWLKGPLREWAESLILANRWQRADRCKACPPSLAGAFGGAAQLAISVVGCADVRGVARAMGLLNF